VIVYHCRYLTMDVSTVQDWSLQSSCWWSLITSFRSGKLNRKREQCFRQLRGKKSG